MLQTKQKDYRHTDTHTYRHIDLKKSSLLELLILARNVLSSTKSNINMIKGNTCDNGVKYIKKVLEHCGSL